jgi:hypothetical protein
MTTDGLVDGNWGADQPQFNSGIGARSQMLRIGWLPSFGGYLEERVRTLVNQTYYTVGEYRTYSDGIPYPYRHYFDFTLRYTRPWNGVTVGGELFAGRDVYGQSFMRFSGFVRYGGDARTRDEEPDEGDSTADSDTPERAEPWGETFVDVGGNVSRVQANLEQGLPTAQSKLQAGPHLAIGARRAVSDNNDLGVRLEYDDIETHGLLGFRAVDYRYRFSNPLALGRPIQPRHTCVFHLLRRWRRMARRHSEMGPQLGNQTRAEPGERSLARQRPAGCSCRKFLQSGQCRAFCSSQVLNAHSLRGHCRGDMKRLLRCREVARA